MSDAFDGRAVVEATVRDVLPAMGLAYVADADDRTWGLSRHTPGTGLDQLKPGQRVQLELGYFRQACLVTRYASVG